MIPFELRQALENGNAILFVGAGMGFNMVNEEGGQLTAGLGLAKMIAEKFSVPIEDENPDLMSTAQYVVAKKKGKKELEEFIKSCMQSFQPDEYMRWIPTVRWKAIYTTNYDDGIEKSYDACEQPAQKYFTVTHIGGFRDYISKSEVPIIHLHGYVNDNSPKSPNFIITTSDYVKYKESKRSLFERLKQMMVNSCFLYTGYSNRDSNWTTSIVEIESEISPQPLPKSFRIDPKLKEVDRVILEEQNIISLKMTFSEFVKECRNEVEVQSISNEIVDEYADIIPAHFSAAFEENPLSTIRLVKNWEYINDINTAGLESDVKQFLRGNTASWKTISDNNVIKRDIEDQVYENILDFATEPKDKVHACLISGSAGYGISTFMKTLAYKLVVNKVGMVFFLKDHCELNLDDVFFSLSTSPDDLHIYFIDSVASHKNSIKTILHQAKEAKKRVIFIIGDRINQLNQAKLKINSDNHIIEPLSDSEINRLIDLLAMNDELNELKYLDREHQVGCFRRLYNRELLVAIREATEGKSFDTIIKSEYRNIEDEFCREAYALTAAFTQNDAWIRVDLLASMLGVSLQEYYDKVSNSLDGIIFYECMSQENGFYQARTRHRIISKIVWERCIDSGSKYRIMKDILGKINLSYKSDKRAFYNLYQDDDIIDSLGTVDNKIQFFDRAYTLDPDNVYILQHYARMLVREKSFPLALSLIEKAIEVNSTIGMLHHTKGYILCHMALADENIEMAERRYFQSEGSYRKALQLDDRDEYGYQSLALLYLMWVEKVDSEDEKNLALDKCEEVLSEGLKKARNKETIWECNARLDKYLGNSESQINSLKNAIKVAPNSIITKLSLAKAYNNRGNYKDSIPLLEDIAFAEPSNYKAAIEYAKAVILKDKNIKKAIAILEQSTYYGYNDPRFSSILGGLYYLDKRFDKADQVFNVAKEKFKRYNYRTMFNPKEYGLNGEYFGKVTYVGWGHSIIRLNDSGEARCPYTKYKDTVLRDSMEVEVKLKFTPTMAVVTLVDD